MPFDDRWCDDAAAAEAVLPSVAPAQRAAAARGKVARKRTDDGPPVLSFRFRLNEPATFTQQAWRTPPGQPNTFQLSPQLTRLLAHALELLHVSPRRVKSRGPESEVQTKASGDGTKRLWGGGM